VGHDDLSITIVSRKPAYRASSKRIPKADRRRALELLASSADGCTEAILLAHGFKIDMLVEMINAGLASASVERVVAGGRTMQVTRVRITEAGRRVLAGLKWP